MTISSHEHSSSITFLNTPDKAVHEKTVIVLGAGRSGTSAVAGACRLLGVAMPNAHPLKHEWSPLAYSGDTIDRNLTKRNIDKFDSELPIWGWKAPRDLFLLDQFISMVRNPHIIIVFRNLLDVMRSSARHEDCDLLATSKTIGLVYENICSFINLTCLPVALVSYEELRAAPGKTMRPLADWLGFHPSVPEMEEIEAFLSDQRAGYQSVDFKTRHRKVSEADIIMDQYVAKKTLYTQNTSLLSSRADSLRQNAEEARKIVEHLKGRLARGEGADRGNRASIANASSSDVMTDTRPSLTAEQMIKENGELETAYFAARRDYLLALRQRMELQREMDSLAMKLGLPL